MEFAAGFIIGLLGSFHCIGMCGPLALALPSFKKNKLRIIGDRLFYNLGRVFTYAFLGLVFGIFGHGIYMFGSQRIISISIGLLIIVFVLISLKYKNSIINLPLVLKLHQHLKDKLKVLLNNHSFLSMMFIGILNGFLPCGFVYMALTAAAGVSIYGSLNGMFFMILFGLGTVPVMLLISFAGNYISLNLRRNLTKAVPVFVILLALVFILRGLNLGIPYISPSLKSNIISEQETDCH
jgi:sulfite exporter TauE/SafE